MIEIVLDVDTGFTGPTSKNGQSGSFITGARECHLVIDQNFVWMFEQRKSMYVVV